MCRECIREPGWSEKVSLSRIADHFIFGIESVGMLPPKASLVMSSVLFWLTVFIYCVASKCLVSGVR